MSAGPGVADSGTLGRDLGEVFVAAGEAAKVRKSSIVILVDEIQNLPMVHKRSQHHLVTWEEKLSVFRNSTTIVTS